MHPADFYTLARCDRGRAARHLLCYDGPGLRAFAADCANHLYERFAVRVPPEHILTIWQQVGLLQERRAHPALSQQKRTVGA